MANAANFPRVDFLAQTGQTFEVIVKYSGDISRLMYQLGVETEILNEQYAIITLERGQLPLLYDYPQIEYIELPKIVAYTLSQSLASACITPVHARSGLRLLGNGTLVAIIDSGIDYTHPDFRNPDGSSRIVYFWDQTAAGIPPYGFTHGVEYDNEQLNHALKSANPYAVIPPLDVLGHGTAVSGIAAGNGASSGGRNTGAAPEASLIVVRMGQRGVESFARTSEVMRAIKYVFDKALFLKMPLAVNLSFGTNDGSHDGSSLFETYIGDMARRWKAVIVAASGNEGVGAHHFSDIVQSHQDMVVDFYITDGLPSLYMTLWKNFADAMTFTLTAPDGLSSGEIRPQNAVTRMRVGASQVDIFYGQPTHYNEDQEVYFLFQGGPVPPGIWRLTIHGKNIVDGRVNIWLPLTEAVTANTAFFRPFPGTTLTLPSTSKEVITVGGYDARFLSAADFSGRGYTRGTVYVKPDLVAPAVHILTTKMNGGYDAFTGTSMAAPFVTGSAALMMEWGIVRGHDPFLYGQRVKAFLQRGARQLLNREYPNPQWGYGALCLQNSMALLQQYV